MSHSTLSTGATIGAQGEPKGRSDSSNSWRRRIFCGNPKADGIERLRKSKMKHHNFEQTSVAKNVCIWIQHAQSLFIFFSNWNFGRFHREKHGSHSNFSDLILGVVPGPAPAGPAGVCLGFLKVGMSLGARKYVFFFVRLVVVVVLMVQKFDVLKAVKLGSLSTLSHYFRMKWVVHQAGGCFGISFIDSKVWMWEVSFIFIHALMLLMLMLFGYGMFQCVFFGIESPAIRITTFSTS